MECSDFTEFASLEETVALVSCDSDALAELLESEKLHTIRTLKDAPLVCFTSILKHMTEAERSQDGTIRTDVQTKV